MKNIVCLLFVFLTLTFITVKQSVAQRLDSLEKITIMQAQRIDDLIKVIESQSDVTELLLEFHKEGARAMMDSIESASRVNFIDSVVTEVKKHSLSDLYMLANNGDSNAQYLLGMTYYEGIHLPENDDKARRWIPLAAKQGHAYAQLIMGLPNCQFQFKYNHILNRSIISERKCKNNFFNLSIDSSLVWLELSAKQDLAIAQYYLGLDYYFKYLIPRNSNKRGTIGDGISARHVIKSYKWLTIAKINGMDTINMLSETDMLSELKAWLKDANWLRRAQKETGEEFFKIKGISQSNLPMKFEPSESG